MSKLSVVLVATLFVALAYAAPPTKKDFEQYPAPLTEIEGSALNPSLYQSGNQDTLETAEHRHYGYGGHHHRRPHYGYGGGYGGYGGHRGGYGGYRGGYGGYGGGYGGYGGGYGGYGYYG